MDWANRIVGYRVVKAGELQGNPKNWRRHPDSQKEALEGVLQLVGWVAPVLYNVRTGRLLDGHLRKELAAEAELPVIDVDISEEEEDLILATFDPIAALADMDAETLGQLLAGVQVDDDGLGAMLDEMQRDVGRLLDKVTPREAPPAPIDQAEALREKWSVAVGDVWEVPSSAGVHRIVCGDSTSRVDMARLLDGVQPVLCVTDPPYGVMVDHSWRDSVSNRGASPRGGHITNDDRFDWGEVYQLLDTQVLYVWHSGLFAGEVAQSIREAGYEIRQQIVWVKAHFALGRSAYHWKHEPCWYAVREGDNANWQAERDQTTVWEHASPINATTGNQEATTHPTEKPVELFAVPICNHTVRGDAVVDPFLGSGTALVACEQLGRVGYGMEIDARYVAVTLERLAVMGLEPVCVERA